MRSILGAVEAYRSLLEASSDWVWETDEHLTCTYVSPGVHELLGYEPAELVGEPLSRIMPPGEAGRLGEALRPLVASGQLLTRFESRVAHKNGAILLVQTSAVPLFGGEGVHLGYRGVGRDIAAHMRLGGILADLNDLKRQLLGTRSLDERLKLITDGVVRIFRADFARVWMVREADLCEKGCRHAAAVEGPDVCRNRARCLHLMASSGRYTHIDGGHRRVPLGCYKIGRVASGEDERFITNAVTEDPRVHDHQWAASLGLVAFVGCRIVSADGTPVGVLAFFRNSPVLPAEEGLLGDLAGTTSHVLVAGMAEEALRASEEKYHRTAEEVHDLYNTAPCGYHSLDNDGVFVRVNGTELSWLQYSRDELVGRKRFSDVVTSDGLRVFERAFPALKERGWVKDLEYRLVRKDGTTMPVLVSATAVRDPDGNFVASRSTVYDITELKRVQAERMELEKRLLHTQKLESLGVLAGGIAHDFNNLLMAILGNLELSLMSMPPAPRSRRAVEQAMQAARRAADLTRQMLAYSGKGQFVMKHVDLSALVRENATLFRSVVPRSVTMDLRLAPEGPVVEADPGQLEQVIMNLLTNASEAFGEGPGTIVVITGLTYCDEACLSRSRLSEKPSPGTFASVEVSDSGCGMSEDTLQRAFDPFFTTKFTGRGLGMSAVLGIVRGHGGAIIVDSTPGEGTTVRVLFPAARTSAATADIPEPPTPGRKLLPPSGSILVVDDEETVRDLCMEYVERLGYRAIGASDGETALRLFEAHRDEIECVLLDLTMPQLNGVSTFRELKRLRPDVKVILCSGYDEQDATRRFTQKGLAGFLQKPYLLRQMEEEISKALGHPGAATS